MLIIWLDASLQAMAKGGPEHRNAQGIMRDYYKSMGKIAVIEGFLGKHIDVLVYDLTTRTMTAVEYQTSKANALRNIFHDCRVCDEVVIVSSSQRVLDGIRADAKKVFGSAEFEKLSFRLLKEFVPQKLEEKTAASMPE